MMEEPINLLASDPAPLVALMKDANQKPFRVKQIQKHVLELRPDIDQMTDLPASLRDVLQQRCQVGTSSVATEQKSKDGTRKWLFRLGDGSLIETVVMPYNDGRRTVCVSTQAGCAMGCVFCATGQMGFVRHLTADEIFEQAYRAAVLCAQSGARLSNVVLMGMGEPLHNYDHTLAAIRRMMADLGIGARHITVSTVGLVPAIRRFALEGLQVKLAVSLHQTEDAARSALMPINRKHSIEDLLDACRFYQEQTGRRVTFEWALIAGANDQREVAVRLGALLQGINAHVNLIPLNPTTGFQGTATLAAAADAFVEVLGQYGVPATLRVRRGIDIDAGCGQLREREQGATSA